MEFSILEPKYKLNTIYPIYNMSFTITTSLGKINCNLLSDFAPVTTKHITKCINNKLFDDTSFYRSDFVIQMGLWGTTKTNSEPNLPINESQTQGAKSNKRGTMAIAHHDKPDNGNNEMFINLDANTHLDQAYGGYCCFAEIALNDTSSWETINNIASTIKKQEGKIVQVQSVRMNSNPNPTPPP